LPAVDALTVDHLQTPDILAAHLATDCMGSCYTSPILALSSTFPIPNMSVAELAESKDGNTDESYDGKSSVTIKNLIIKALTITWSNASVCISCGDATTVIL
jgi:hypothetical protein